MERVRILAESTEPGAYYDAKGRYLKTMGDINVSPGDYVWTNGRTIYGHQTAGEMPYTPVLEDPILPVVAYVPAETPNMGVIEITKNGKSKMFFEGHNVYGYVGDKKHAYAYIIDDHGGRNWYNLNTGECLGSFTPSRACVGYDGSLLTLETGRGAYSGSSNVSKRWRVHVLSSTSGKIYQNRVYTTNQDYNQQGYRFAEPFLIRRNGVIVKTIDLDAYIGKALSKLGSLNARIAAATNDSDHLGTAVEYYYEQNIPIPTPYISTISLFVVDPIIYKDGTFSASIRISADGYSYNWFVHLIHSDQLNPNPYKSYPSSVKSQGSLYVKDWIAWETNYYLEEGLGRLEGIVQESEDYTCEDGLLLGPTMTKTSDSTDTSDSSDKGQKVKPTTFITMGGFKATGVYYTEERPVVDIYGVTKYPVYYAVGVRGGGSIDIYHHSTDSDWSNWDHYPRGLYYDPDLSGILAKAGLSGGGIITLAASGEYPTEYELNDGYTVKLGRDSGGSDKITVYTPEGNKLFEVSNSGDYQFSSMPGNWSAIIVGKLSGDLYIILSATGYPPPILCRNGKLTALTNIQYVYNTFTATPYKDRKDLLRKLRKILSG